MKYGLLLCLVCTSAFAGVWSPPIFAPTTHADGSVTWLFSIDPKDIRKEDRGLEPAKFNELYVGGMIAFNKICPKGWEVTDSRTEKKRLVIEGRCL